MNERWPETGVFTFSLDVELIWGTYFGLAGGGRWDEDRFADVRPIFARILDLLKEAGLPATWAFVGHLFLDQCERVDGVAHPGVVRPGYRWFDGDWLRFDPCSDIGQRPAWYGRDLVDLVRSADARHDIGGHSFSHILFGDPDCSREAALSDLKHCMEAAVGAGCAPVSFVYPQGKVGHEAALAETGFRIFRGKDHRWYYNADWVPAKARKACHILDQTFGLTPPVVMPRRVREGLWELPGSLPILPAFGFRRFIPMGVRAAKAKRGIDRAVRERRVFHLWTHPWNFVEKTEEMLGVLTGICEHAARDRDAGRIRFMTMREVYDTASKEANRQGSMAQTGTGDREN
ncbi:polysaccharide deacetylase family protein [Thermodesulfobacteriota bacterium]